MASEESLTGLIERVTYHNPESGFAVLKVKVQGHKDLVSVLANLTSVSAGEHLQATGRWVMDREHGRQFKADTAKTTHPTSVEGIERYLGSGAIRGIGPRLTGKITKLFGAPTLYFLALPPSLLTRLSYQTVLPSNPLHLLLEFDPSTFSF